METVDLHPESVFCQMRFCGDVQLNATQNAILRASKSGEILVVHRTAKANACTFLAGFLCQRCGWRYASNVMKTRYLTAALQSGKDVVIECTASFDLNKALDFTRAITSTRTRARVIVMCYGVPVMQGAVLMDITP
jgi:hypothetical protein